MARRRPRYGETRATAAQAIRHVRRLVRVGHCGEAATFLRENPLKVRSKTTWRLLRLVQSCKPWIPPGLRRR